MRFSKPSSSNQQNQPSLANAQSQHHLHSSPQFNKDPSDSLLNHPVSTMPMRQSRQNPKMQPRMSFSKLPAFQCQRSPEKINKSRIFQGNQGRQIILCKFQFSRSPPKSRKQSNLPRPQIKYQGPPKQQQRLQEQRVLQKNRHIYYPENQNNTTKYKVYQDHQSYRKNSKSPNLLQHSPTLPSPQFSHRNIGSLNAPSSLKNIQRQAVGKNYQNLYKYIAKPNLNWPYIKKQHEKQECYNWGQVHGCHKPSYKILKQQIERHVKTSNNKIRTAERSPTKSSYSPVSNRYQKVNQTSYKKMTYSSQRLGMQIKRICNGRETSPLASWLSRTPSRQPSTSILDSLKRLSPYSKKLR